MQTEAEMIDDRVTRLEGESSQARERLEKIDNTNQQISSTMSSLATSYKQMADTMEKVKDTMERFTTFEAKTEAKREAEQQDRDRTNKRIDDVQKDMGQHNEKVKQEFDNVYKTVRHFKDKTNDGMADINQKLAVKIGTDKVKESNTDKTLTKTAETLKVMSERRFKIGFWLMTTLLAAFVTAFVVKGGLS